MPNKCDIDRPVLLMCFAALRRFCLYVDGLPVLKRRSTLHTSTADHPSIKENSALFTH